jgi:hypothetical protein
MAEAIQLNELAKMCYEQARKSGFHREGEIVNIGEKLMLIVSELAQALEADRFALLISCNVHTVNGWVSDSEFMAAFERHVKDRFQDKLADAIIRILDLCCSQGIDIGGHVLAKMRYNSLREFKHGGKKY